MWIRDAVPTSVPGVRTVLYGYDSKLVGSKSFQSITDIARSLILHLKSGGWNLPSSKHVVFLAHSLEGLVLKDAVVQMADRDKSVANVLNNIRGAIMFGVPSLGMEQSHLLAMVEGRPNESLVQDLPREGGSNYIRQLNDQFEGLSFIKTTRIFWAYETQDSPTVMVSPYLFLTAIVLNLVQCRADGTWDRSGPPAVLVNPASATCHYYRKKRSMTIPINKDHSHMVKYSKGDVNLGVILHSIAELCAPKQHELVHHPEHSAAHISISSSTDQYAGAVLGGFLDDSDDFKMLKALGHVLSRIDGASLPFK